MQPELSQHEYPERTVRQVAADARRALARVGWCPERSRIDRLRCADDLTETELAFGRQLWLFESQAIDSRPERAPCCVFGAIEYSVQYGYLEPLEDGVFDSETERQRFVLMTYQGIEIRPSLGWQILRALYVAFMLTVLAAMLGCLVHYGWQYFATGT